jgi:hypothetical protein
METGQTRDCCEKDPGGSSECRSHPAKCGKHEDVASIANDGRMARIVSLRACGSPVDWSSSMPMLQEGFISLGNRLSV